MQNVACPSTIVQKLNGILPILNFDTHLAAAFLFELRYPVKIGIGGAPFDVARPGNDIDKSFKVADFLKSFGNGPTSQTQSKNKDNRNQR